MPLGQGYSGGINPEQILSQMKMLMQDPQALAQMQETLAQAVMLPEELDKEDFPIEALFAKGAMPPKQQKPQPRASTGAGPSLGQTNRAQNLITPLFQANPPAQLPFNQLIGPRR